jgi:hypothetical protein
MCAWSSEFFGRWCRWAREDCGWILSRLPRAGRERTGSTFPDERRWRTCSLHACDWMAIASEQPSHMPVVCYLYIQLRLPLRSSQYGFLDRPAIQCGWSASLPSRASQHPQAAHQADLTRQHRGNRSNYHQTQYRVDQACLRERLLFPSHRSVARQIACLLRRVYLGLPI